MASARESEEIVSSGNGTNSGINSGTDCGTHSGNNSGTKIDSGAQSPNAAAATSDLEKPGSEINLRAGTAPAENKIDNESVGPSSSSTDVSKASTESEPSLGKTLTAARERRGVSRADVVAETRIPAHYIAMIENSDYGLISDQLYLMPFLRRYAAFLNLDGEEVAMRFVREVQRAEVAATPRMSEPLGVQDRKRIPWGRVAVVVVVLSAIVVLYVIASEHHRGEFGFHHSAPPSAPSAPSAIVPPAVVAPAPPAANPPMTAEPPMAGPAPQAVAPAAPSRTQPRKPPSPADSENE